MSIINRLKKMESQIIKEDSNFCGCDEQRSLREPGEPPLPEICEFCGKPLFIIHVTSPEIRGDICRAPAMEVRPVRGGFFAHRSRKN